VSFIGKYEVVRELASGGMAKVFLARVAGPKGFEKRVVVKKILPHLTGTKSSSRCS
jgi:serine/threonine-protein kinase